MAIKNYTTAIDEAKTVGEIMGLLAAKGARAIRIDYDELNRPDAISFVLNIGTLPIPFKLPCNFAGVLKAMAADYKSRTARYRFERNSESASQSRRVAWRIIKDWVAAQMALVEAEQASMAQVFLPYAMPNEKSGRTVFEQFIEQVSKQKSLPSAEVIEGDED
jgi:hypothetical protein